MEQIEQRAQDTDIIMVGDYIDRGDESASVLAQVMAWEQAHESLICLLGNHEQFMLSFLDNPTRKGRRWLRHGGLQTLASYGIGGFGEAASDAQLTQAAIDLRDAMPDGLTSWLRARPTHWQSGNLHVVHAAADPGRDMDEQDVNTLLWGHPDFAATPRTDGQWIAHGHTITDRPGSDGQGRIAVDTGAYATGRLTAALIAPDGTIEMVQA